MADHARADKAHRLAAQLQREGRLAECEEQARLAVELEDRPPLLRNHLMFLAKLLWEQGRFEDALPYAERSATMYADGLGPTHSEARYMAACVAMVCRELGDEERAQRWHTRATGGGDA
jgi:tetratricopeptide (TPR) repeat protein